MMTPEECQTRSDDLQRSADSCANFDTLVELEATAASWRRMASLAKLQDIFQTALAARALAPGVGENQS